MYVIVEKMEQAVRVRCCSGTNQVTFNLSNTQLNQVERHKRIAKVKM